MSTTYERMLARYAAGDMPWDDTLPPPEIVAVTAALPPGRALDLGCGYGRAAIYLAQHGWQVDGIDFIPSAIAEARRRALAAGVEVQFHEGDVTALSFLNGQYDLALDVGCAHSLDEAGLRRYVASLRQRLRPGAWYVLSARLRAASDETPEEGPRGLDEAFLLALMAEGFHLERSEHGSYSGPQASWPSAWFWFSRQVDNAPG